MSKLREQIEQTPEKAGKILAEKLGWEVKYDGRWWKYVRPKNGSFMMCYSLFTLLDLIHEAEKNVIEMVGYSEYGKRLWRIGLSKQLDNLNWNDLAKIATATAQQRLEAMLICLGVEDLEGDK